MPRNAASTGPARATTQEGALSDVIVSTVIEDGGTDATASSAENSSTICGSGAAGESTTAVLCARAARTADSVRRLGDSEPQPPSTRARVPNTSRADHVPVLEPTVPPCLMSAVPAVRGACARMHTVESLA